ncbi:MAG: archaetidylserine decarboxylase [Polyangiaceae bacterium]
MSALLSYATAQLLRALPREGISRAMGRLADHRWAPRLGSTVVNLYSRAYDVDFDDCVESGGWESFDAFFTRRLKDGVRPMDGDSHVVVSPSDGKLESMGRIDPATTTFTVKGSPYRVDELLGDADEAKRYAGGAGCVIYLSPRDYHRVHAPVAGSVRSIRSMRGDYLPVNAMGVKYFPNLFARNRRVAIAIDTPEESGLGRVTVVMVAAMIVGRITVTGVDARDVPYGVHSLERAIPVAKGDELGMFHLGSTAVVFLEKAACERWAREEGPIRLGEALALATKSDRSSASPASGKGKDSGRTKKSNRNGSAR